MSDKRKKRSRSGANTTCFYCGKKLRGQKGLKHHTLNEHPGQEIKEMPKEPTQ